MWILCMTDLLRTGEHSSIPPERRVQREQAPRALEPAEAPPAPAEPAAAGAGAAEPEERPPTKAEKQLERRQEH